jgi:hypothetical protein
MTGLCGGHAPMIPPIAQQGKPLRLGISPGGYKRRVPSRTSCVRSVSIRFMQTDSLFRKPSENEGSETQQRPRFVSAKMDVPNILIFGTLFCRDPPGIRKVDR